MDHGTVGALWERRRACTLSLVILDVGVCVCVCMSVRQKERHLYVCVFVCHVEMDNTKTSKVNEEERGKRNCREIRES